MTSVKFAVPALVLLVSVAAGGREARRANSAATCETGAWGPPRKVADGTRSAPTLQYSSVVSSPGRLFVVGSNLSGLTEPTPNASLVAVEVPGGSIGRPEGDFTFAFPKAGIGPDGRLHLLWGEPSTTERPRSRLQWMLQSIESVWTSQYDPVSRRWSRPARILEAQTFPIAWSHLVPDPSPAPTWDLRTSVLAPLGSAPTRNVRSSFLQIGLRAGRWQTSVVALPGQAVYAEAGAVGSATTLAYVRPSSMSDPDNAVLVMHSADGREWSTPVVLGASRKGPIHGLVVLIARDTVHVLWKQIREDGAPVIRHRASWRGGATWSEPSDLAVSRKSGGETVGLDGCGNVHIVYEVMTPAKTLELTHVAFTTRWSAPRVLLPTLTAYNAHLSARHDGNLVLSFVAVPRNDPDGPHHTYLSQLLTK